MKNQEAIELISSIRDSYHDIKIKQSSLKDTKMIEAFALREQALNKAINALEVVDKLDNYVSRVKKSNCPR